MGVYKTTEAFKKIVQLRGDIRIIQGGQASSKTISILQIFILMAISKRENLNMSVVARTYQNLRDGALLDFEALLKDMNLYDKFIINKTDKTYIYGSNRIQFFSADKDGQRMGARRTHLYVNEADYIDYKLYRQLEARTSGFTIMDFNPRMNFWALEDLKGLPDVDFLKLTYLDNAYIPEGEMKSLMRLKAAVEKNPSPRNVNEWKVYGLGEVGVALEGVIFQEGEDWNEISELPEGARYLGAGLDFGFSHVTAIVKLYQFGDKVIIKEVLFKAGMVGTRIADFIKSDDELMSSVIVCDNQPVTIAEIRAMGVPVISHKKGQVLSGIDLMLSKELYVTGGSKNMLKEFRSYSYATDRAGKSTGVPDKAKDVDNSIDAARYVIEHFLSEAVSRTNSLRWVS